MKRTIWMTIGWMTIGTLLLLGGATLATAQSLGDAARAARKNKAPQPATAHHFDNDNLPTTDKLSVVGPAPAATASNANQPAEMNNGSQQAGSSAPAAPAADPKTAEADRKKNADDWKDKLDAQKKTIESLNHELDLIQREYRLKAVAEYSDAGNRLRNSTNWDKEEADFKKQLDEKQKAVDAAKQDLENLQEQARKAGVKERD
ncbi:MAG TPA: hypothetical protein VNW47_07215 [Terriglobales bacterium]|jgi:hypothetical protein|nr:hypothetical protein [Terriglobales bacterium]